MKKVKLVFWLVVLVLVGLTVYQNPSVFMEKHALHLDLFFVQLDPPEFENGLLVLACFLAGFLLSYVLSLSERFRARRTLREMKETLRTRDEALSSLKREVEALRPAAVQTPEPPDPAGGPPPPAPDSGTD